LPRNTLTLRGEQFGWQAVIKPLHLTGDTAYWVT
jgi:hypothetical protein